MKKGVWRRFVLAVALAVFLLPAGALGADLSTFASALDSLAELTRAADRARSDLDHALNGGSDAGRYETEWRDYERRLERDRIQVMADIAGVSPSAVERMRRDGLSWESIARRYGVDPRAFGYGSSPHDKDRDHWKGVPPGLAKKGGTPPGLAKKGGMPPGQAKKH